MRLARPGFKQTRCHMGTEAALNFSVLCRHLLIQTAREPRPLTQGMRWLLSQSSTKPKTSVA